MKLELIISILALLISGVTMWLTYFHRGSVKMSRPQFFALIPEEGPFGGWLKFFMRVLVFSTGKRGCIVERLYVTMRDEKQEFPFHYWMYGDTEKLAIGSGVFVSSEGLAANHHFVQVSATTPDEYKAGRYHLEIYAHLLGDRHPIQLFNLDFQLADEELSVLKSSKEKAVFFTWNDQLNKYVSRIDTRKSKGRAYSVSGSGSGLFSWQ